MGVTVRQPVHHKTQHRCSTEEVSFVVKPYVAQYLWLVTVFVNFCVPTFFLFCFVYIFGVCQCCKYAFLCVLKLCVPMFFLLSDHQIFVCFFLCWRTDKNKQTKKKLLRFYTSFPQPHPPTPSLNEEPPPPHHLAHNYNNQPHQAAANKNYQLCTVMSTSFLDFCTFCTSRLLTFLW